MRSTRPQAKFIEVGRRLEEARKLREQQHQKGFGKKEVAEAAGMSPSAYTQWINGETKSYDAEKMLRVAEYLKVRVQWLMFGLGTMEDGEIEQSAAELVGEAPADVVNETLNFMSYNLSKSLVGDPEKLGRYLKMIDNIVKARKP